MGGFQKEMNVLKNRYMTVRNWKNASTCLEHTIANVSAGMPQKKVDLVWILMNVQTLTTVLGYLSAATQ